MTNANPSIRNKNSKKEIGIRKKKKTAEAQDAARKLGLAKAQRAEGRGAGFETRQQKISRQAAIRQAQAVREGLMHPVRRDAALMGRPKLRTLTAEK